MDDDLLSQPADEACRRVALHFLSEAVAAHPEVGHSAEALHDFRVALRRLRSWTRAHQALLGDSVRGAGRRRLRKLVAATGDARDADVQIEWLTAQESSLPAELQAGAAWLIQQMTARREAAYRRLLQRSKTFGRLARRLTRRLGHLAADSTVARPSFAEVMGRLIDEHADELQADLAEVRSATQVEEAHTARISVKRLRYLVEPLRQIAAVAAVVDRCKALQDVLGELHDLHVTAAELAAARLVAPSAHELAGLDALSQRAARRRDKLFARLESDWLASGVGELLVQVRALRAHLGA